MRRSASSTVAARRTPRGWPCSQVGIASSADERHGRSPQHEGQGPEGACALAHRASHRPCHRGGGHTTKKSRRPSPAAAAASRIRASGTGAGGGPSSARQRSSMSWARARAMGSASAAESGRLPGPGSPASPLGGAVELEKAAGQRQPVPAGRAGPLVGDALGVAGDGAHQHLDAGVEPHEGARPHEGPGQRGVAPLEVGQLVGQGGGQLVPVEQLDGGAGDDHPGPARSGAEEHRRTALDPGQSRGLDAECGRGPRERFLGRQGLPAPRGSRAGAARSWPAARGPGREGRGPGRRRT